ncbi:MAG TPA: RDD family protein [Fibrobacteria bacterium]|nr:RDD family protein [Fibrobacteria bacterium]
MSRDEAHTVTFRTPENLEFSLALAGPSIRFVAWLVDMTVIGAVSSLAAKVLAGFSLFSRDLAAAALTLAYFGISVGYGMAMEWFCGGQTLGKRLMRLRVLDAQGLRLRGYQVVIRNLFRFLDMLPAAYLVGGAASLLSRRCQRLGDVAANTIVIRNPDPGRPDLEKVVAGKFNSFLGYRHLSARLRRQISPAEAGLAFQALLRRDELEDAERVDLFKRLKEHFASRTPFPPEAADGLPDEQYVRNVVDILYR